MIGSTYSVANYEEYKKTGNKNLFEEIIDKMMMDGLSPELKSKIEGLPLHDKRMNILAFLDKDRELFMKIKSFISSERLTKVEHLKEVILMLRDYVKIAPVEKKKFGEVMTDLELVKHILSRIPKEDFSNPNKTFCDMANGTGVFPLVVLYRLMMGLKNVIPNEEERYKHIIENQIFVSEIQEKNTFLFMCLVDPYDEYNLNIYSGDSLGDGFKRHMKEVWKVEKFDYVIGNPPFNQMIDMKFVQEAYKISDVVLFVHPSTWLLDEKGKQRKFNETKEIIKDHLDNIELFNGNKIFDIVLAVPCTITYIDRNKKSKGIRCIDKLNNIDLTYDNIYQINKFSNIDIYPSIKSKIFLKTTNNLYNIIKNDKGSNFYVNLSQITGNVYVNRDDKMTKDDFYTLCGKNISVDKSPRVQREKTQVSFNTSIEANNFIKYIKSDFVRFCLSILKNNKNVYCGEMEMIPWLDFSKTWTDDELIKEFKLTTEEVNFINKNIPKYYE